MIKKVKKTLEMSQKMKKNLSDYKKVVFYDKILRKHEFRPGEREFARYVTRFVSNSDSFLTFFWPILRVFLNFLIISGPIL